MRTLLLSKEVASIEALVQHGNTPVDEKNQSVSFMGNSMKQNLTLLQSGVNPMRRFSLGLVGHSRWAD